MLLSFGPVIPNARIFVPRKLCKMHGKFCISEQLCTSNSEKWKRCTTPWECCDLSTLCAFFILFFKILTVLGLCWGARAQQLWCAGFFSCRRHMGSQFPNEESNLHPPPCIGRQILNHWTTKEVPSMRTFKKLSSNILSFLEWVNAYVKIHLGNTSDLCISLYTQYPSTKNEKKGHILYDCIYMTCPEQVNLLKSKIYWLVVARVWWEGRIGTLTARG